MDSLLLFCLSLIVNETLLCCCSRRFDGKCAWLLSWGSLVHTPFEMQVFIFFPPQSRKSLFLGSDDTLPTRLSSWIIHEHTHCRRHWHTSVLLYRFLRLVQCLYICCSSFLVCVHVFVCTVVEDHSRVPQCCHGEGNGWRCHYAGCHGEDGL